MAELLKEDEVKRLFASTRAGRGAEPVVEIRRIRRLAWFQGRTGRYSGLVYYANKVD